MARETGHGFAGASAGKDEALSDIARVEARIEELREFDRALPQDFLRRKVLIAVGAAWIVLVIVQIVSFVPFSFIAAVAAAIGGVVLLGSNDSTWKETEAALRKSEAVRAEMIEAMQLRAGGRAAGFALSLSSRPSAKRASRDPYAVRYREDMAYGSRASLRSPGTTAECVAIPSATPPPPARRRPAPRARRSI